MSNSNSSTPKLDTDLITLRAVVAIAEEKTFSAAAKKIGRTQSAVSLQISKLEDRLGVKLFERGRTIRITEAGEELIAYARRILDLADQAMQSITASEPNEILRIGFADYLAPVHLPAILERFKTTHPKVELKLNLGMGVSLYNEMKKGNLDIVVAGADLEGGKELFKEQLVWVATKNYRQEDNVSLILMPPPCHYRKMAFETLMSANFSYKVVIEVNSIHAVRSAVTAGMGVSVIAKSAVTEDLEVLEHIYPELPKTTIVAYTANSAPKQLTESFLEFLMERLGNI